MAPPLLTLKDISLHWGGDPVLDALELNIARNDRLCLIGRNGTGKSTLLKIIAGLVEADGGERWVQPRSKIAYLPQEPDVSMYDTLYDYVVDGLPDAERDESYRADVLMEDLQVAQATKASSASGGELRRAALARVFIGEPDLVLLDEPTNHLDIATIEWLERYLKDFRGAFMIISHDRTFLANLATACLWLDRGVIKRLESGYDKFEEWQMDLLAQEKVANHKMDRLIKEEHRWSVEGISARRTRNQGRMRKLRDLKQDRSNRVDQEGTATFSADSGSKSGALVADAKGISKSYDGRILFENLDIRVGRKDRIALIGPNGVGKTTLLKILMGELEPDEGTIKLGVNLTPLIIDQKRSQLDPNATVEDALTGGRGDYVHVAGQPRHVRTYMKEFLFDPSQARQPVSALSGGERNRLLLAASFAKPSNLLILDEPTNDLDMETLDLLQEVLSDYDGTILLVSHDRDFIDRLVTRSFVFEGDGRVIEYAGGYSDYVAQRKQDERTIETERSTAKTASIAQTKTAKPSAKLSYKDQRLLDTLPDEIEILGDQIQQMEASLADPDFYSKDPKKFSEISKALEAVRGTLDEKEMRWLELDALKEGL